MTSPLSLVSEQRRLRGRTAERSPGGSLVRAFLVESETLAVNPEQTLGGFPVLTFAAHAFAERAGVQLAVARFANPVEHAISFGRQLLTQTFLEIRSDIAGQAQHVDERRLGARFFRAF